MAGDFELFTPSRKPAVRGPLAAEDCFASNISCGDKGAETCWRPSNVSICSSSLGLLKLGKVCLLS